MRRRGVPCIIFTAILSAMVGYFEVGHIWFVESLLFFSRMKVPDRGESAKYYPAEDKNKYDELSIPS